ncbi:hypothetical protein Esti_006446 [Eimeria stiedai]
MEQTNGTEDLRSACSVVAIFGQLSGSRNSSNSEVISLSVDGLTQRGEACDGEPPRATYFVESAHLVTLSVSGENEDEDHEQQQSAQPSPVTAKALPAPGTQQGANQGGLGVAAPGLALPMHSGENSPAMGDQPQSAMLSREQGMQKQEGACAKGEGQQQPSSPSVSHWKSEAEALLTRSSANAKKWSSASFLEAFHRRQRTEVSREQQRRSEALLTLKHWRGGGAPKQGEGGSDPLQKAAAAASAGPRRIGNGAASRSRVVNEMVALFSRLSLSKQQRAALSCRQTIAQLEQQQRQLTELLVRLNQPACAPKARGALVKARSYQLQMQQQQGQRPAAQHRRLPPHMLLPLPSLCSNDSNTSRDNDPWRRLLKRVREPPPRRASLPCFVGRRGSPHAAADSASPGVHTAGGSPPAAEPPAPHNAAAAAAATFSEDVEYFASSHRTASEGWRNPRRGLAKSFLLVGKERNGELLQQAEGACLAALADADGVSRQLVTRALEVLGRVVKHQKMKCQQRLEVAALLEARRPSRGVCAPLLLDAASHSDSGAASSPRSLLKSCQAEEGALARSMKPKVLVPAAAASAAAGAGCLGEDERGLDLQRLSSAGSPLANSWAEDLFSMKDVTPSRKDTLFLPPSGSDYAEEDLSLLDAETDCEYLLGRQLLPYERVLLKYRMLRRSSGAPLVQAGGGGTADTRLVEQLLLAVEDGCTPADGELGAGGEEQEELWCLAGGSKTTDKAAQIEQLLGLVGELQQADLQQENLIQRSLLFSKDTPSSGETASALRAFFNGEVQQLEEAADGGRAELRFAAAAAEGQKKPSLADAENSAFLGNDNKEAHNFPSAQRLYRAHYLLGPWRGSFSVLSPPSLHKPQQQ